jgi:uncharacterized Zn-binding protein involved in type VI secretion
MLGLAGFTRKGEFLTQPISGAGGRPVHEGSEITKSELIFTEALPCSDACDVTSCCPHL